MPDSLNPRSHFDQEMRNLQDAILRLGGMVEKDIFQAVEALKNRDLRLAERVIHADLEVDEVGNDIIARLPAAPQGASGGRQQGRPGRKPGRRRRPDLGRGPFRIP